MPITSTLVLLSSEGMYAVAEVCVEADCPHAANPDPHYHHQSAVAWDHTGEIVAVDPAYYAPYLRRHRCGEPDDNMGY